MESQSESRKSGKKNNGAVGRLVKRAGADTTLKNAIRDGAEFAWVPSGDTCAFCITLASRGWRRASEKALKGGHAEHIHSNCDCTYAVRFDGKSGVKGYDPEKYLATYEGAEGDTPKEKINALRRENYAAHKEEINARKRAAYAERKERMAKKSGWDLILSAEPTPHTEAEIREFLDYAEGKGCRIVNDKAFDGDIGMLRDQIDAIEEIRKEFDLPSNTPMKVHFQDMAAGDLAKTGENGDVIHFNPRVLRDRGLTNAYLNEDKTLSSTDAKGIACHEMGHVISRYKGEKGLETAKKAYYNLFGKEPDTDTMLRYLKDHVSTYATEPPKRLALEDTAPIKRYKEIIPEILAKHRTSPDEYTGEFIRLLKVEYGL